MKKSIEAWAPACLSVLRIVAALLFLEHGTAKLFGLPPTENHQAVVLASLIGVAGLLELVGGALLAAGLFTRFTAFILSGEMAVAYFMVHAPKSVFPLVNHGEDAVLFCFIFLYLAFAGGGAWSLDRLRRRAG